jgi:peptidoglycan/LPS O-acetylase OafA/YrhL
MRLVDVARGRDNNFQLLRFLAASAVILFHSYALTGHLTEEPLWRLAPELNFGMLGVGCFFVISGFLVTQSSLTRARLVPFLAARALRIYPALVIATLFSIVLAAGSIDPPIGAFLGDPLTFDYVWRNALGWEVVNELPGAYIGNPYPYAVNGSLWTLPLELRLYALLAIAGVIGLLSRPYAWTLILGALIAVFVVRPEWFPLSPNIGVIRELALLFALGSIAYIWRAALPLSLAGLSAALALIVVNPAGIGRGVLFDPLLAYAVLTIAYHPALQWRAFNGLGDYSYGLYVYSFPIQQTIVYVMPESSPMLLFALAMLFTLAVAALSWHMVEKPMLGLKSHFHRAGRSTANA